MTQSIEEQIRTIPAIEPEGHFFKIGREMLGAEPVPCPHDAALEKRERGLNRVGVNVSHNVDLALVAYCLVGAASESGFHHGLGISAPFVGHNHVNVFADVLADIFCETSRLRIGSMEKAQISATLTDANDDFLVFPYSCALTAPFATDVGFIHFYFPVEHISLCFNHGRSDSMAEIPCCLVAADSDGALNLASRHAFLGFAEQKRSGKPFRKGQMGIVKDRASGHAELIIAVLAVKELLFSLQLDHGAFTAQAAWPFREAQAGKQFAALGISREQGIYVN